ncbi:hypothetical protein DICVIV_04280 [Dictyocaulus viviparus]|uniref:Uncharacterized protein n=1 Tax=Dictyocaulus viviparus TaxID=29172 RepID=A0A0D8Y0I4_DICVI|nr:hypothetical protein DICVIV_04280 [Dictyocaulus viviparus]
MSSVDVVMGMIANQLICTSTVDTDPESITDCSASSSASQSTIEKGLDAHAVCNQIISELLSIEVTMYSQIEAFRTKRKLLEKAKQSANQGNTLALTNVEAATSLVRIFADIAARYSVTVEHWKKKGFDQIDNYRVTSVDNESAHSSCHLDDEIEIIDIESTRNFDQNDVVYRDKDEINRIGSEPCGTKEAVFVLQHHDSKNTAKKSRNKKVSLRNNSSFIDVNHSNDLNEYKRIRQDFVDRGDATDPKITSLEKSHDQTSQVQFFVHFP